MKPKNFPGRRKRRQELAKKRRGEPYDVRTLMEPKDMTLRRGRVDRGPA